MLNLPPHLPRNNMKYTILPLAVIATILVACNNGSGPKAVTSNQPANFNVPANNNHVQQPGQFATNTTPTTTLPGATTQPAPVTNQTVATVNTSKAGLNPEHGQPGHRCDIAVGAPLDSKSTTPVITNTPLNTTPANTSPVVINSPVDGQKNFVSAPTTTTTTPTTTKAGLNPEHGQPGHRCDISVGAPLDSKPTTTTTPTVTSIQANTPQTTTSIPQVTPVIPAKTEAVTAPGMNPEHGKPGHRCDIAVGAPLDSKATIVTEKEKTPAEKKN